MTISTQLEVPSDVRGREGEGRQRLVHGWSLQWDRCQVCGTTEFPHRGRGLCSFCYVRLQLLRRLPPLAEYVMEGGRNNGAWSRDYAACRSCGTTERRHHGRGFCVRCYMRWFRRDTVHERAVALPEGLTSGGREALIDEELPVRRMAETPVPLLP